MCVVWNATDTFMAINLISIWEACGHKCQKSTTVRVKGFLKKVDYMIDVESKGEWDRDAEQLGLNDRSACK